jgi:hypothetical protein
MTMSPILIQLFTAIPSLVKAVQAILSSDAGHTIESAVVALIDHNTPNKPNAPALAPDAPAHAP